ncbi:MAG: hypothetical protein J7K78_00415 [Thaumarchaeota archaeon]|nr:hypothetical protein [Nitrososphaerota archaeon]
MSGKKIVRIMIEVLKPTWMKICLFIVFAFIWIGGVTQTYTFIKDIPGIEKPPLYDLLRPYDFWSPWIFFSAPFYLFIRLLCSIYDFCSPVFAMFPAMGGVRFPLAGIAYSYMASAWMAFSWEKWFRSRKIKVAALLGCLIPLFIIHSSIFLLAINSAHMHRMISYLASSLILNYLVLAFYVVSLYGLYKGLRSILKRR